MLELEHELKQADSCDHHYISPLTSFPLFDHITNSEV